MPQPNDLSRSLVALDHNSTIIAVVEMSQSSWLVGGVLPGIERQPRKKLEPSPQRLLAVPRRKLSVRERGREYVKTDYLDVVQFHQSPSRQTLDEQGARG